MFRTICDQHPDYRLMGFFLCRQQCIAIFSALSIGIRALLNQQFYYLFMTSI